MRTCITVFLVFIAIAVQGQNYQLFNVDTKKLFRTTAELAETYNVVFDSVTTTGTATVFHPYKAMGDSGFYSDTCYLWNDDCYLRNKPTWIGKQIIKSGDSYVFYTLRDSVLNFNFNLAPLQAHIFYEDQIQRFSISRLSPGSDTMNLMGTTDTVIRYQISHTDLQGNFINSALNNWQLVIGKQFGLITFFRVDVFPLALVPLVIMGNESPDAGFYEVTKGFIYDYSPGDVIQSTYRYNYPNYPELNQLRYTTDNFIERHETSDLLRYKVFREVYDAKNSTFTSDTVWVEYNKHDVIASIPFDFQESEDYRYSNLTIEDYCGFHAWTYINGFAARNLYYCHEENIWCGFDTFGYDSSSDTYVQGIGLYSQHSGPAGPITDPSSSTEVNYFSKGGIECGQQEVGIENYPDVNKRISISPNPASGSFIIRGNYNKSHLEITDLNGRIMLSTEDYQSETIINISNFPAGIYLVRLIDGKYAMNGKLIVK